MFLTLLFETSSFNTRKRKKDVGGTWSEDDALVCLYENFVRSLFVKENAFSKGIISFSLSNNFFEMLTLCLFHI